MRSVLTDDTDEREEAFREHKENGEQMVHRLRDWEEGDILWGYESVSPSGSTGKTFSRRRAQESREFAEAEDMKHLDPDDAHESAKNAFDSCVDPNSMSMGGGADTSVFLYAARIKSVRTEPHSSHDPEPPLKFARLGKVAVVDSEYIPPEDES